MASNQGRTPQELFVASLCQGVRQGLSYLLMLIIGTTILSVRLISRFFCFQTPCLTIWPSLSSSKVGAGMRSLCRVLFGMSPWTALLIISTGCSFPIVVGATIEQDEGEIKYVMEELKAMVQPYLPHLSLLAGICITSLAGKLVPKPQAVHSVAQEVLDTTRSVMELVKYDVSVPGDFPLLASGKMIHEIRDILSEKDQQIANLRQDLQGEDDEIVGQLAQKDGEVKRLRKALRRSDETVIRLEVEQSRLICRAIADAQPTRLSPSPGRSGSTKVLEEQLKVAGDCKAQLEEKVKSMEEQTVDFSNQIADLQASAARQADEANKERGLKSAMKSVGHTPPAASQQRRVQFAGSETPMDPGGQDAAAMRQSTVIQLQQQVQVLEGRLSSHDREAAEARHIITNAYSQEMSQVQAQVAERENMIVNIQGENRELQQQIGQTEEILGSMKQYDEKRQERLGFLEWESVQANELYEAYRVSSQNNNVLAGTVQKLREEADLALAQINPLQSALNAAKQQMTELSVSKRQLEIGINAPLNHPLVIIALDEKDKQLGKARSVIETLNENLVATRKNGGPSAAFLKVHEVMKRDRQILLNKLKTLERNFYTVENNARKLQTRERTLTARLDRLAPSKGASSELPISLYAKDSAEMTVLEQIQAERDELVNCCRDQAAEWHGTMDAVLGTVDWQLDGGGSEAEAEEKCRGLDEEVGDRVKSLLEKLRWRLVSGGADGKLLRDQRDIQEALLQTAAEFEPGLAEKRKGREETEKDAGHRQEEAGDEDRRKRLQQS